MNRQTSIAYIDLLTVLMALFVVVTGILLSQNHALSKGNIMQKAEFVAILDWPKNSTSDVDLWVSNPSGQITNFRHRDNGLVTLDRDDQGINDQTMGADGSPIDAPVRREMATVRAIMPGRHIVNVMLYALRGRAPIEAHVQIIKLNPYEVITERTVPLTSDGEERTIASFDVRPDGSVGDINSTSQFKLAEIAK
jgi:hypothetical protein